MASANLSRAQRTDAIEAETDAALRRRVVLPTIAFGLLLPFLIMAFWHPTDPHTKLIEAFCIFAPPIFFLFYGHFARAAIERHRQARLAEINDFTELD